jgi:hypothetical protein
MEGPMTTWTTRAEHDLTPDTLRALLDNAIPAIRIRGFASPAECAVFATAAKAGNLKYYSVKRKIGYIGQAQYEYRWNPDKSEYFKAVEAANRDLEAVLAQTFDPVERLVGHLRAVWPGPVDIAEEPGQGRYYAGVIRLASQGVDLHVDYAPLNTLDCSISAIDAQLGWNFFAEDPGEGGLTTIYNNPWNPERAPGEIPQSYDLDRALTEGVPSLTYAPTAGDVVIFNTRNPHEIGGAGDGAVAERVSIGSFVGRMPDGALVLWS